MTTVTADARDETVGYGGAAAFVTMAAGCVVLVARPVLTHHLADPSGALILLFVLLGAAGMAMPLVTTVPPVAVRRSVMVLGAGIAAFVTGRLVGGLPAVAAVSHRFVAMNTLAAVAEELFFRRFVYGYFEPRGGAALAVAESAMLFTIVHLTVYGWWALPIDFAAGLVLGWQRWATGTWTVPAATHIVANFLMVV